MTQDVQYSSAMSDLFTDILQYRMTWGISPC